MRLRETVRWLRIIHAAYALQSDYDRGDKKKVKLAILDAIHRLQRADNTSYVYVKDEKGARKQVEGGRG